MSVQCLLINVMSFTCHMASLWTHCMPPPPPKKMKEWKSTLLTVRKWTNFNEKERKTDWKILFVQICCVSKSVYSALERNSFKFLIIACTGLFKFLKRSPKIIAKFIIPWWHLFIFRPNIYNQYFLTSYLKLVNDRRVGPILTVGRLNGLFDCLNLCFFIIFADYVSFNKLVNFDDFNVYRGVVCKISRA